jgi:hypothetical protein
MGFFDDLAMGTGLKDRDDDYYERTAQTLGRESQGGSAQREAQYRSSMGMNNGATVGGGQLDKRGGLLPFMEGGGTIGAIARGIGGKGGGKTEQASNSQDLGLGGLQSFLGTRGPAAQSELGNAQMQATLTDNLPGYFDPATREYVPWYVDLFNGGGFNSAGGQAQEEAAMSGAAGIAAGGAPMAQPGLLANNQLSDMEMANRSRASQMTPSLGSQLSDMEMANRSRAGNNFLPRDAIYSARLDEANRGGVNNIANQRDPRLSMQSTGYGRSATVVDFLNKKTDLGAAGYGPMGIDLRNPVDNNIQPMPQGNLDTNPEYQEFIRLLENGGGFDRELQDPEWLMRTFKDGKAKGRL